jgi:hypothetical protein
MYFLKVDDLPCPHPSLPPFSKTENRGRSKKSN